MDTHTLEGREQKWEHSVPLELAKSATASADFLVFFLQFFRCSNVSDGTNMGRTVKSSPNAESTVGKFLKWFAASLEVSPFFLHVSYFKFADRAFKPHFHAPSGFFWNRSVDSVCFSSEKNSVSPASYTDVSPSTKLYAQRKAERRKWWRRGFAYHFSLSHSPVHFIISQSRVPRVFARLCVKNSAHEEEANVSPKKLECPPENCWLGQIVLLKGNFGSDTASKSGYLMSCNSTPSANPNTFSPTNIHTTAPADVVLR